MQIEVSIGEAIDKYSILELKQKYITDLKKRVEIQKELDSLKQCSEYISMNPFFYKLLLHINDEIWVTTDKIKTMKHTDESFAYLSNLIFEYNQKRFRLKTVFNNVYNSTFIEQKSYTESHCKVIICDEECLINKIAEINYIAIQYDTISFETTPDLLHKIKGTFKNTNILYDEYNTDSMQIIDLIHYDIPVTISREFYCF